MSAHWFSKRYHVLHTGIAFSAAVAFLAAINYCNLEAFAAHPTQSHDTHQSAAAEHHDEKSSTPAHHHEEGSVSCCSAIQAIATPESNFNLASSPAWQFQPLVLQSVWVVSFLEPSRPTSGLSPPAREPTPSRPFYRTTYANHAPPVCLA